LVGESATRSPTRSQQEAMSIIEVGGAWVVARDIGRAQPIVRHGTRPWSELPLARTIAVTSAFDGSSTHRTCRRDRPLWSGSVAGAADHKPGMPLGNSSAYYLRECRIVEVCRP
jgi:hypothetical protein